VHHVGHLPRNTKSSWTPMLLKLRIFRLHETLIRLIHSTTRRSTNWYIPAARNRQPSCIINKLTNSNNRDSSRCITLMNSTKTWGKNRCHTRPIKPSEILNQPTRSSLWTMCRDLRSKPQIHTNRNCESINKRIY